ncbi:MAG TPA: hypothetical protein VJK00_02915, partial [Steroidobacteraceae bacterium]|nr:hypothetical protein [Steroidobacteraceae bacterium]
MLRSSLLLCGAVWLLALMTVSPASPSSWIAAAMTSRAGAHAPLAQSRKSLAGQLLVATEQL